LRYEGQLVHRFTRRAPVAEFILRVFQEQGWSWRIDDPLPPRAGRPQAVRLRNEVHALNRRLMHPLIKFFMDGTGQGICWRPRPGGGAGAPMSIRKGWLVPPAAYFCVRAASAPQRLTAHGPRRTY
jgi:hypothetical protein